MLSNLWEKLLHIYRVILFRIDFVNNAERIFYLSPVDNRWVRLQNGHNWHILLLGKCSIKLGINGHVTGEPHLVTLEKFNKLKEIKNEH